LPHGVVVWLHAPAPLHPPTSVPMPEAHEAEPHAVVDPG